MITEDYVSFETAKLLKDKGFKEWCFKCYGVAILHNGADISFDEECELRDYGRENEIEYIEGGRLYGYGCNNHDKDAKVWAAPTLWVAMKWLRETHSIDISVVPHSHKEGKTFDYEFVYWNGEEYHIPYSEKYPTYHELFGKTWKKYEEACEAAIKYCLENLIYL